MSVYSLPILFFDMLTIQQRDKERKKNLIVFIHGLIGDDTTWTNGAGRSFGDLLLEHERIRGAYDIGYFSYYTRLFDAAHGLKTVGGALGKLFGIKRVARVSLDIESIRDVLVTELAVKCMGYEGIVFIAHSMGGLVAKSAILEMERGECSHKIKMFLSLAVPHNGSNLAVIGRALSSNVQISNLAPLSEAIHELNSEWVQMEPRELPRTVYFQGKYDAIVPETSSIGFERQKAEVLYFEGDHFSIAKPESVTETLFMAVQQLLLGCVG